MNKLEEFIKICKRYNIALAYLFGSQKENTFKILKSEEVEIDDKIQHDFHDEHIILSLLQKIIRLHLSSFYSRYPSSFHILPQYKYEAQDEEY